LPKTYSALALFSGGLDSLLAVLWMQKLGVKVIPIFFRTPFFTEERAVHTALTNGLDIQVIDISEKHLVMLKNPRYGFGKNFNPCIDCHGLMFRLAGDMLPFYKADFLISGEVLSQRPMSQRKDAMNAVGKLSGNKDLLIRPLCQRLLEDTKPIREGWIDKSHLLAFSGRSRKPQIQLAKELGVVEYPSPAGGCRLTDRNYTIRLRDLVEYNQLNLPAINLLKYGRHFRLDDNTKLIIGRDENDNKNILDYASDNLLLLNEAIPGPLALLCATEITEVNLLLACSVLAFYNSKSPDIVNISYGRRFPLTESIHMQKATLEVVSKYII
jgi:tRNA-uridine 2-sulfurtransferase